MLQSLLGKNLLGMHYTATLFQTHTTASTWCKNIRTFIQAKVIVFCVEKKKTALLCIKITQNTAKKMCKNCANARTKTQGDDVKKKTKLHTLHSTTTLLLHFRFLRRNICRLPTPI